jgi:hypothetical protein
MKEELLPDPTLEDLRRQVKERGLKRVDDEFVIAVSEMPREELQRRILVQADWHSNYSGCLDGIEAIQHIGGGGIDHCRQPEQIRIIVKHLIESLKNEIAHRHYLP